MTTIKHTITSYEVLPDGVAKPSSILKILQDAATIDVANLGADYESLRSRDMIFVITKIIVQFNRLPRVNDCISVRTWNSGITGVSFVRNYVICVGDETLATATSQWALVSYSERRILRTDALLTDVTTNADEALSIGLSRRIKLLDNTNIFHNTYKASLTDMDTNYHVNNTRYGDLLVDYSGIDFEKKAIQEFEIHFLSELKSGESIAVDTSYIGGVSIVTAQKDKAQVFVGRIVVCDK